MNIQSVIVVLILSAQTAFANPSFLCEDNNDSDYARFSGDVVQRQSQIIEVLTWNVLKFKRENSFSDLIYLTAKSDIAFIQESVHSADLQTQFQSEIQTGTRFPQIKVEAVKAPALEPVVNTPKVTGFSTIEIQGHKVLLVNIHGLNANQGLDFERHIHQVYEIIKKFKGPVIWAGDFNTWNPIRTMYLKNKAKDLGMTLLKPEVDNRKMKLDHIIVRGFKVNSVFILETYESSDHWPVRAELEFSP
jgi:endonuclease/exonuclease/phosphatase (EEP) superfamily protein YafD